MKNIRLIREIRVRKIRVQAQLVADEDFLTVLDVESAFELAGIHTAATEVIPLTIIH